MRSQLNDGSGMTTMNRESGGRPPVLRGKHEGVA
jgi:hypothetical protein